MTKLIIAMAWFTTTKGIVITSWHIKMKTTSKKRKPQKWRQPQKWRKLQNQRWPQKWLWPQKRRQPHFEEYAWLSSLHNFSCACLMYIHDIDPSLPVCLHLTARGCLDGSPCPAYMRKILKLTVEIWKKSFSTWMSKVQGWLFCFDLIWLAKLSSTFYFFNIICAVVDMVTSLSSSTSMTSITKNHIFTDILFDFLWRPTYRPAYISSPDILFDFF